MRAHNIFLISVALIVITSCTNNTVIDIQFIPQETTYQPELYFCPRDNCSAVLISKISQGKEIRCVLYDIDLDEVAKTLEEYHAKVIVDNDTHIIPLGAKIAKGTWLTHDKFCVIDNIVITGSFNPTHNCNERNNNNLVVFTSAYLAENYRNQFDELWQGKRGEPVRYPFIFIGDMLVENYFCPDDCSLKKKDSGYSRIHEILNGANKSIYFMTFSFTDDGLGDVLVKKHKSGIIVRGVFEKTQISKYSEYAKLLNASVDVELDTNPYKVHHKVFIVDSYIVITGSTNPTSNGFRNNDENIVIIYDKAIAKRFIEEFEYVSGESI